jgi:phosphomevalonate kinase
VNIYLKALTLIKMDLSRNPQRIKKMSSRDGAWETDLTISAPGKVLLAGGYLVLERENVGLVVAVDQRFYTRIQWREAENTVDSVVLITVQSPQFNAKWIFSWNRATGALSQQSEDEGPDQPSRNVFVETTLQFCCLILLSCLPMPTIGTSNTASSVSSRIDISILADNAFYSVIPHLPESLWETSNSNSETSHILQAVRNLPKFLPLVPSSKVQPLLEKKYSTKICKTGLGSSAALVSSLAVAFLIAAQRVVEKRQKSPHHDSPFQFPLLDQKYIVAQIIHAAAQGKVGSGFDIAAAFRGSHVFHHPSLVEPRSAQMQSILATFEDWKSVQNSSDAVSMAHQLNQQLNEILASVAVPSMPPSGSTSCTAADGMLPSAAAVPIGKKISLLQVILADVSGGSDSPGMSRKIMAWKTQQQSESRIPHWDDLRELNERIILLWKRIDEHKATIEDRIKLASSSATQWIEWANSNPCSSTARRMPCDGSPKTSQKELRKDHSPSFLVLVSLVVDLVHAFREYRMHFKAMGEAANVPTEPDPQSSLADATEQLPGVVAALVPGAGGHDALVCVYVRGAFIETAGLQVSEEVDLENDAVRNGIANHWASWTASRVCPLDVHGVPYGEGIRFESGEDQA